jgi:hypothetical protein
MDREVLPRAAGRALTGTRLRLPEVVVCALVCVSCCFGAFSSSARAATTQEQAAVAWATARATSHDTHWYGACLAFVFDAYSPGINLWVGYVNPAVHINGNTVPLDIWPNIITGTKGNDTNPPYGALVFWDAHSSYPSHVALSLGNGNLISTPDAVDETGVHYENMGQHPSAPYLGWWLPDSNALARSLAGSIVQWNGDTNAQRTSWFVGSDGRRRWVPDIRTYSCLRAHGAPDAGPQPSWLLDQIPDLIGIHVECPAGDMNGDGHVTIFDLSIFLGSYGRAGPSNADLNYDGVVNYLDLSILLRNYGI